MAKKASKVQGIVLDDVATVATVGHNSIKPLSMIELARNEVGAVQAIVDAIVASGFTRDELDLRNKEKATGAHLVRDYQIGVLMACEANYTLEQAKAIVAKPNYNALPHADNSKNRTQEQTRLIFNAARRWSHYMDLAFGQAPKKDQAPPSQDKLKERADRAIKLAKEGGVHFASTISAPLEATPEVVRTLAVHKAKTKQDAFVLLRAERDRVAREINENAALLTGDEGSAWRIWIASAPRFDK